MERVAIRCSSTCMHAIVNSPLVASCIGCRFCRTYAVGIAHIVHIMDEHSIKA